MKKRGIIISFGVFTVIGIILLVLKEQNPAFVSFGFASLMLFMLLTFAIIDKQNEKKKDPRYGVLKQEHFQKSFEKITKDYNLGKLKAVGLLFVSFDKEYETKTLLMFSKVLNKLFKIDPMSYDQGIIILLINIHPLMINELMKHLRVSLKVENIDVSFKTGFSSYTGTQTYQELKQEAAKEALAGKIVN